MALQKFKRGTAAASLAWFDSWGPGDRLCVLSVHSLSLSEHRVVNLQLSVLSWEDGERAPRGDLDFIKPLYPFPHGPLRKKPDLMATTSLHQVANLRQIQLLL